MHRGVVQNTDSSEGLAFAQGFDKPSSTKLVLDWAAQSWR